MSGRLGRFLVLLVWTPTSNQFDLIEPDQAYGPGGQSDQLYGAPLLFLCLQTDQPALSETKPRFISRFSHSDLRQPAASGPAGATPRGATEAAGNATAAAG